MSDESMKWEEQWSVLLTRCYGAEVQADAGFKSSLMDVLKRRTAENLPERAEVDEVDEENWKRLLSASYVPCHPDVEFKNGLMSELKTKQIAIFGSPATGVDADAAAEKNTEGREEELMSTILQTSYQPIQPRRDFQTRLLENLKERQRNTSVIRRKSRRRAYFLSGASSLAAAAMVVFIISLVSRGPDLRNAPPARTDSEIRTFASDRISTPTPHVIPEALLAEAIRPVAYGGSDPGFRTSFASAEVVETNSPVVIPASFANYRAADAFAGASLPDRIFALRDVEMNTGSGWMAMTDNAEIPLSVGMSFRASGPMGHLEVDSGSLVSLGPDSILTATSDGLTVEQGFLLVEVPEAATKRFRLHFAERDIAVEPGTDLTVLAEPASKYAAGGAPAPMVMVVDRPGEGGGLALARGKSGIGPLLTRQLYRLDNYVTPDLPGRTMCDTECAELFNIVEMRKPTPNAYLFAGSNAGSRQAGITTTMVISPAGYSQKGDRWLADSYKSQPTIKLKYLSDAYFGFANERRDLALALALGGNVIIDAGNDQFFEIHK